MPTTGQANADVRWPKRSTLGYHTPHAKKPSARRRYELWQAGVSYPQDETPISRRGRASDGRRVYPDSQWDPEVLEMIESDDSLTDEQYRAALRSNRRVWEPLRATPLVLDFTEVKEPLFPKLAHPSLRLSQHPDRPFYEEVMTEARRLYPERAMRDAYYWTRMDRGELPADFNPYPPGTDRHEAFCERIYLYDDRPTGVNDAGQSVLMTSRQVARRAARKLKRGGKLTDDEFHTLYKPVEQWDMVELAKGWPRDSSGKFPSTPPSVFMQAEMKERIERHFKETVRMSMRGTTVTALKVLAQIIDNDEVDYKGKPVVAASTKTDAAKFLIEHLLGKPKQVVEEDISVKLQGILAGVMVSPETVVGQSSVEATGRMVVAQRGSKEGFVDHEVKALEGYVDADWFEDEDK